VRQYVGSRFNVGSRKKEFNMARFSRLHLLALAAATIAVAAMTADAQPPGVGRGGPGGFMGGRGPGMPGGGGLFGILRNPQIQDEELKLSDDQKGQLRELGEKLQGEGGNVWQKAVERLGGREAVEKLEPEERRAKFQEIMEEFRPELERRAQEIEKQVAEILEPDQFKRLKQIELQWQGVDGLVRPDVAQALGLSEDQQKEIKAAIEERNKEMETLGEEMRGMFPGGFRELSDEEREQIRGKMQELGEKRQAIDAETRKKAMGVLTDDQKAKMPDLMGEPFEFRRPEGGFFGGPGGRQRPGRPAAEQ